MAFDILGRYVPGHKVWDHMTEETDAQGKDTQPYPAGTPFDIIVRDLAARVEELERKLGTYRFQQVTQENEDA